MVRDLLPRPVALYESRVVRWLSLAALLASTLGLAGCELAADIFKAGVWVGVLMVVLVIGGIVWLVTKKT